MRFFRAAASKNQNTLPLHTVPILNGKNLYSIMTSLWWNSLRLNRATNLMLVLCLILGMMSSYVTVAQEIETEVRQVGRTIWQPVPSKVMSIFPRVSSLVGRHPSFIATFVNRCVLLNMENEKSQEFASCLDIARIPAISCSASLTSIPPSLLV
jgi:hypothetical protein